LKPCSAAVFLPFLEEHFPTLVELYRKRYSDRAFLPKGYTERLTRLMASLRQKYAIGAEHGRSSRVHAPKSEQQLDLF
jgi:hypothetical protein